MPSPVFIIGMGLSPEDLTDRQRSLIESADILAGGRRLLDHFPDLVCERWPIDRNLAGLGDFLAERMTDRTIVVLASGDPLFFGIGAYLARRLGSRNVRILPNISAVATAFARLGRPWQEARVVSLHGRKHIGAMLRHLAAGDTVAVYTDPTRGPAWLAGQLLEYGLADVVMNVLEQLGGPEETIREFAPHQAQNTDFDDLNIVVLTPDPKRQHRPAMFPGMPDDWFAHQNGLITKSEVRAVVHSRLRLFDRAIFWDLGAGSGSVAVESGGTITRGDIWAVEQHPERIAQIHANRRKFGIGNLHAIQARLPEGLAELPDPDRVFIGGGGRELSDIIQTAAKRLKPGGIIVVNTVLIDTLAFARQTLGELGFNVETLQIQTSRAKRMPYSDRFEAANPVWIITGSHDNPSIESTKTP